MAERIQGQPQHATSLPPPRGLNQKPNRKYPPIHHCGTEKSQTANTICDNNTSRVCCVQTVSVIPLSIESQFVCFGSQHLSQRPLLRQITAIYKSPHPTILISTSTKIAAKPHQHHHDSRRSTRNQRARRAHLRHPHSSHRRK